MPDRPRSRALLALAAAVVGVVGCQRPTEDSGAGGCRDGEYAGTLYRRNEDEPRGAVTLTVHDGGALCDVEVAWESGDIAVATVSVERRPWGRVDAHLTGERWEGWAGAFWASRHAGWFGRVEVDRPDYNPKYTFLAEEVE